MTEQLSESGPPGPFPARQMADGPGHRDPPGDTDGQDIRLALSEPTPYLAGQHFLIRLTAPDGYRAQRSYSVASAPGDSGEIELTVEHLPDGEVSSFLHEVVMVGDKLEVRGPIGGWFVWRGDTPAVLIGGGSGVVPLMAMLRLARQTGRADLVNLVVRSAGRRSSTTPRNCRARRRRSSRPVPPRRPGLARPRGVPR